MYQASPVHNRISKYIAYTYVLVCQQLLGTCLTIWRVIHRQNLFMALRGLAALHNFWPLTFTLWHHCRKWSMPLFHTLIVRTEILHQIVVSSLSFVMFMAFYSIVAWKSLSQDATEYDIGSNQYPVFYMGQPSLQTFDRYFVNVNVNVDEDFCDFIFAKPIFPWSARVWYRSL